MLVQNKSQTQLGAYTVSTRNQYRLLVLSAHGKKAAEATQITQYLWTIGCLYAVLNQLYRQISCINIRFAHQITGCADMVIPYVTEDGKLCHTLIISPPGCGKTTLLRDLVRQISDGWETFPGNTVGVVDERSEIGGSYQGIPQNDVGIRTDVLDCCSKAEGMVMLLRSMAPQVIAVDEIGNYEDIRAIEMTLNSGCKLLATVHGSSIDEIRKKPLLERLIKEHVFERYIILQKETAGKIGKVREIYDERGTCLYQRQRSVC